MPSVPAMPRSGERQPGYNPEEAFSDRVIAKLGRAPRTRQPGNGLRLTSSLPPTKEELLAVAFHDASEALNAILVQGVTGDGVAMTLC